MGLTEHQTGVLRFLSTWKTDRDGALSGPEISRSMGHRTGSWAGSKLKALEARGYVAPLGQTFSGGCCWTITPAGRRALEDTCNG